MPSAIAGAVTETYAPNKVSKSSASLKARFIESPFPVRRNAQGRDYTIGMQVLTA